MAPKMKRQRLVFSEKLMYSFIQDYKERGCLWDITNPDYKCAEKRRAALSELASKYDITEEEAKKKLNSLRSTYLQEKKKVEESKKSGDEIYEPSLYWFHKLEFLYDVIIPRRPPNQCPPTSPPPPTPEQGQVMKREKNAEVIINQEEVDQEHLIVEFVEAAYGNEQQIFTQKLKLAPHTVPPPNNSGIVRKLNVNKNVKRRPLKKAPLSVHQKHLADHEYVQPTRDQPHERSCQSPQPSSLVQQGGSTNKDEFGIFCCSIASQLRTLPPADAIEMQLEIQQLVSRRRLAVLKNQQNLSLLRTWENSDSYHQYNTQSSAIDDDSGQEESETLILGQ